MTTQHPLLTRPLEELADALTGTQARRDTTAQFLPSGVSSYEVRWKLIEKARHHIHIVAFSLMKDETGYRLRDALLEKLRQGVAVRMIFDDGVMYSTLTGGILKELQAAGAQAIRYHKVFRDVLPDPARGHPFRQLWKTAKLKLKRRFHEKYMIVDGTEAVLGGINWGNKYAYGGREPKAWRDTDMYVAGSIVADIQRQFIHDFFLYDAMDREYHERTTPGFSAQKFYADALRREQAFIDNPATKHLYFPPPLPPSAAPAGSDAPVTARYVPHKPYDENRLRLTDAYLQMFRQARQHIYWGCHGIRPPRIIGEALAEAVRRGVQVHLITNTRTASRTLMLYGLLGWMYWESSNHFRWLIEHGIHVHEWQKPGAFHSKNLLIDDVVAAVGSYNIARGSTFHHTESTIIVYGGEFPLRVRRQFETDLKDCREVTLAQAKIVPPKYDPFLRPIEERNGLITPALLTDAVRRDWAQMYGKGDRTA